MAECHQAFIEHGYGSVLPASLLCPRLCSSLVKTELSFSNSSMGVAADYRTCVHPRSEVAAVGSQAQKDTAQPAITASNHSCALKVLAMQGHAGGYPSVEHKVIPDPHLNPRISPAATWTSNVSGFAYTASAYVHVDLGKVH